ncbi:response regulator [Stappia sp. ES.058]|uniref:response regulator n=1 Tax=Stappia sp. ES.058 TaxID=1881061 RepID=UPI00087BBFB5|nr:response regulator [Stappia sp. ES.058]SDU15551.1 Response regulator receiver domain-containing protein [Stappia sp. ES.058]
MNKKQTILCIEDEPLLLKDLKEELEDAGYEVVTASNGKEGLDALARIKPDLILCDMMMPIMNGPDLLERIRKDHPALTGVPFIFLTALATRENIIKGKRLGADDYLTKPIDFDMLLATVEARLKEVERISGAHKRQLAKIAKAVRNMTQSRGPLDIVIVGSNPKITEPIRSALDELGCKVTLVSQESLAQRQLCLDSPDITLLVYSKIVHYFLQNLTRPGGRAHKGKIVLLAPPHLPEDTRNGLVETGVDDFLEYPYRPVDVFKLLMAGLQPA